MAPSRENVTILCRDGLSLSRRVALFAGGLCLGAAAGAAVLAVVAVRLHQENGALSSRLREAEAEIAAAREGLDQVRAEEAKIREWLGVDEGAASAEEPRGSDRTEGGRGSLGDVDLEVVALEDLATAVAEEEISEEGLGLAAWALASDLADLATLLHERKRHWDALPSLTPVDGEHWVTSPFGWRRSPFTGAREFHSGVDFAGPRGTPIVAAGDGLVVRTVNEAALGRAVTLDHGNGIETVYGHLDRLSVREGERVSRGKEIGKMGSTGQRSTGPHLHYSVRVDGKYVNPKNYLLDGSLFPYPIANR